MFDRYGDLYTENNVAISGIHTHAGPGGYLQYVVYIITSFGFVHQSFDVVVDGIEKSIIQAHDNLRPGSIFVNKGKGYNLHTFFLPRPLCTMCKHAIPHTPFISIYLPQMVLCLCILLNNFRKDEKLQELSSALHFVLYVLKI